MSEKPKNTNLRSRFSLGQSELARIASVNIKITIFGEKVFRYVQDYQTLWEFYSVVSEKWQIVKHIFGTITLDEVKDQRLRCIELLDRYKNKKIDRKTHNNLLAFRDLVDKHCQLRNLGFETEIRSKGNKFKSLIND